jgi:hypothetical protein
LQTRQGSSGGNRVGIDGCFSIRTLTGGLAIVRARADRASDQWSPKRVGIQPVDSSFVIRDVCEPIVKSVENVVTKIVQFLVALLAPLGVRPSNASRADYDRKAAAAQSALIAASRAGGVSNMSAAD